MTEQEALSGIASRFGHRKLSALLGTLLGGQVAGQDVLVWAWSHTGFAPLPEDVATSLFTLIAAVVFYFVNEERAQ